MPKEIATAFVFQSDSNPAKTYQCLQYTDGTTSCDCPGWKFKRASMGNERSCKHVRYVAAGLGSRHAISVVEQSTPAKRTPQRAMAEPSFGRSKRRFNFEE